MIHASCLIPVSSLICDLGSPAQAPSLSIKYCVPFLPSTHLPDVQILFKKDRPILISPKTTKYDSYGAGRHLVLISILKCMPDAVSKPSPSVEHKSGNTLRELSNPKTSYLSIFTSLIDTQAYNLRISCNSSHTIVWAVRSIKDELLAQRHKNTTGPHIIVYSRPKYLGIPS
ncbi:hypothetical protein B0T10DRAFT_465312 [Thelonectria olida]|uniref:Uncharacterized protein n=1 Tax=Thelonectria olida TaxID=1576542 RepID=A0A9P9AGB5_9HYPO|nr:hypothetical protein B0T10DRAFT_465312 [Thelonectria olida]